MKIPKNNSPLINNIYFTAVECYRGERQAAIYLSTLRMVLFLRQTKYTNEFKIEQ